MTNKKNANENNRINVTSMCKGDNTRAVIKMHLSKVIFTKLLSGSTPLRGGL